MLLRRILLRHCKCSASVVLLVRGPGNLALLLELVCKMLLLRSGAVTAAKGIAADMAASNSVQGQ